MCLSKNIWRHWNCTRCKCVKIGDTIAASPKWALTVRTILEPPHMLHVYHKVGEDFKCLSGLFSYLGCVMMFLSDAKQSTGNIAASSHRVLFPNAVNVMNWTMTRVPRAPWDSCHGSLVTTDAVIYCWFLYLASLWVCTCQASSQVAASCPLSVSSSTSGSGPSSSGYGNWAREQPIVTF